MSKSLSFFLIVFVMTPALIFLSNGIESAYTPVFFLLSISLLYVTESIKVSFFGIFLIALEVMAYFQFGPMKEDRDITQHPDYFYETILICTIIVSIISIRLTHLFARKIDQGNERLVKSRKLKSISTLAGGLAHEVNNPLTIIYVKSEVILRSLEKSEQQEILHAQMPGIVRAIDRVTEILSKLEIVAAINPMSEAHEFDIQSILSPLLDEKEKSGISKLGTINIKGDAELLQWSFKELVENARYASIHQSPKPWIQVTAQKKGQSMEIRITNSGKPLSQEVQSKIFDPFFTTKNIGEGLGLGLSIVKAVIEMHNGSISYNDNSVNPQFEINLPLA